MKFMLWTREDRNKDNPVMFNFYDGDILFTEKNVYVQEGEFRHQIPLKDVCMIDFDYKEYKDYEKG